MSNERTVIATEHDIVEKRGPGRPRKIEADVVPASRAEEVRQERRRRIDLSDENRAPLSVNKELLDPVYHYRWINEENMHKRTVEDDYDQMTDPKVKTDADNEGAVIRKQVGRHPDGKPKFAYLCRKPKWMHDEDFAARQRRVNESEEALRQGQMKGGLSASDPRAYVPTGFNGPVDIRRK